MVKLFFKNYLLLVIVLLFVGTEIYAQKVDYSVVFVPEESGTEFIKITQDGDYVCLPLVKRNTKGLSWFTNHILDVSKDGKNIAYLSFRNNTSNIFVKSLEKQGSSLQRTNRNMILDFSYSNDGKYICFTEQRGKTTQLFQTSADKGYVCRQLTSNNSDYSPVYAFDMQQIFFSRMEAKGSSIWSYNIKNNFLSSLTPGMNPYPYGDNTYLCVRTNGDGRSEIWKVNYETGIEECIVSDIERSFTSPRISPDRQWVLFVGGSKIQSGKITYWNTDIYVARIDGTDLMQLTYHAADDLSPVWSKDGKYIYFVSQRGSADGCANVWRMSFNYIE